MTHDELYDAVQARSHQFVSTLTRAQQEELWSLMVLPYRLKNPDSPLMRAPPHDDNTLQNEVGDFLTDLVAPEASE